MIQLDGRKEIARQSQAMRAIFTIGHSTRPIAEFVALLRQIAVDLLIDVRSVPRSREHRGPAHRRAATSSYLSSQLDLLRDAERVIDLDAKVADGAFELRMPEEQLHRP
jgi:hypothetical protein